MEELQRIDRMRNSFSGSENTSMLHGTYFMAIFQIKYLQNAKTCNTKLRQALKMEVPSVITEILNIFH